MCNFELRQREAEKLAPGEIEAFADAWAREFPGARWSGPAPGSRDTYFMLMDAEEVVLSLGCLCPVEVVFCGAPRPVLGIGGVVANVKGRGYGKILVTAIARAAAKRQLDSLGFCASRNAEFYRKCGLHVEAGLRSRFWLGGAPPPESEDEDVLCLPDSALLAAMLKAPNEPAHVPFMW